MYGQGPEGPGRIGPFENNLFVVSLRDVFLMSDMSTLEYPPDALSASGEAQEVRYFGLTAMAWAKIAIVSALFCATFRFNLYRLWEKTNPFYGEANWGHSIFIPIISLYFLYVHREELLKAQVKTSWTGLLILVLGLLLFAYGIYPGQNDFVKDFGMVVALFGTVLLMCGWQVIRIAWFPIVFLVCGIPWPGLVYSWVAGPLQQLAARVAVWVLNVANVKAYWWGTKIFIYGHNDELRTLNVAEACAGLRSLMTFVSVAAAVAFLSSRAFWQKVIITVSAIPIAIFCNTMRVSGQGLIDRYVSREWSEGFAHQFVGMVMLIPAFLFILLVCWIVDHIFVEEADLKEQAPAIMRRQPAIAAVAPVGAPAAMLRRPAPSATAAAPVKRPAPAAPHSPAAPAAPRQRGVFVPPPSVRLASRSAKTPPPVRPPSPQARAPKANGAAKPEGGVPPVKPNQDPQQRESA